MASNNKDKWVILSIYIHKGVKVITKMPDKIKIEKPKIPPSLAPTNFQEIYDKDEPYLTNCIIHNCSIDSKKMDKIEFSQVLFQNVTFNDVTFRNIELTDVVFEHCDLSNADFMEGVIHRVDSKNAKY